MGGGDTERHYVYPSRARRSLARHTLMPYTRTMEIAHEKATLRSFKISKAFSFVLENTLAADK